MSDVVVFEDATDEKNGPNKAAIVASFSNGRLKVDDDSTDNMKFGYFCATSKHLSKQNHKILVAETDNMQYVGRNFGPDSIEATAMCKYMLAVHDRRTGKVRLVDANLFHLRPTSEDSDHDEDNGNEKAANETDNQLSYAEKHARLTLQFGTAKGKRLVQSYMRNQFDDSQLKTALATVSKESVEQIAGSGDSTDSGPYAIPPHDKNALQVEDVYSLDTIISPAEKLALIGPASVFIKSSPRTISDMLETNKYPGYVLTQLNILPVQPDIRQERSCQLLYWYYMHQLLFARHLGNASGVLTDAPAIVKQSLLNRFTIVAGEKNGRPLHLMPARFKDLLRSHMLVLCLILEEFSLDFTALQKDLDVSIPQLEKCFQALGCKTTRLKLAGGEKQFKAVLTVPLTFPSYKARAGRR